PTTPPHPPTAGSLPAPAGDILLSAARKHGHQHPSLTPPGQLNRRSTRPLTPPRPHNRRSTRPLHPATPTHPPTAGSLPSRRETSCSRRVRGEGGGLAWAGCDRARGAGAAPSGPAGEVTEAAAEAQPHDDGVLVAVVARAGADRLEARPAVKPLGDVVARPHLEEHVAGPRGARLLEEVGEQLSAHPLAPALRGDADGHDLRVVAQRDPGVADELTVALRRDVVPPGQRELGEVDRAGPRPAAEELLLELEHPAEVGLGERTQPHDARLRAPAGETSGRRRYSGSVLSETDSPAAARASRAWTIRASTPASTSSGVPGVGGTTSAYSSAPAPATTTGASSTAAPSASSARK